MNYSQMTSDQQAAISSLLTAMSPGVSKLSQLLNQLAAIDAQYLSLASADLALLTSSEYTLANLAATLATSSAPVITSATHNFTADEANNILNITAGTNWTPGLYKIISANGTSCILDRSCATVASPTVGTGNVLAMVPNPSGFAGVQGYLSRADIVSIIAHIETALALNDSAHRQLWVKSCGPTNL